MERPLSNVILEEEMLEILGINRQMLEKLRNKREFPFVQFGKGRRVYLEEQVKEWLVEHSRK